jgi:uncharacterized protein
MATTPVPEFPSHRARRLSILFSVRDHAHHVSLAMELLKRARRSGLAGATIFQADEGYGASGRIHRQHLLSDDAPLIMVAVDRVDRVDEFLGDVADILGDVLVTVVDVEVIDL